ncbi:uncharacterized protein F5147DRAFT_227396 [Suillus discolor]|uniref:Secreted protein n=1 Tax=Suillus discolor TaxID=1912936 RepID=A0A9P7JSY6_9AGAM|nr:uncharacterized protein F5147DRAFT_227396 [Suillus discolor]KAG2106559.1 hypothetical protein F5147DRAFT_227396 [Suillus discolor]
MKQVQRVIAFLLVLYKLPSKLQLAVASILDFRNEYCNRRCLLQIEERRITAEPNSMRKCTSRVEYGMVEVSQGMK